jgi:uncharacterized protein (TIGR03067 family)
MLPLRCLCLVVGLLAAADDADEDPVKRDLARLQGEWRVVKLEANGKTAPAEAVAAARFLFKDNTIITREGDKEVSTGFVRLDPGRKPAEIEISPEKLPVRGKTTKGIYQLDGDTLLLALAAVGEDRPASFAAPANSNHVVFTLQRVKR